MVYYNIHNVRFYQYEPKAIQCIVFNEKLKLLALSRSDNVIEIWNCQHKPFKQHSIIGRMQGSIEALAWCNRWLFAAGQHNFINEYDICDFKKQSSVTGGFTWCLATSPNKSILAAGTEQGIISLYNIQENGLIYLSHLSRQGGRILSIGWHPNNELIAVGSTDFIHIKHINKGQILEIPLKHMKKKAETTIWCISLLSDMTIVSGDSGGKTCFWDGIQGTLIESLQTHQADILALCVSSCEKTLYVAGIDPVIVQLQLVDRANKRPVWLKSVQRVIHSHDVLALSLNHEGKLFSGGVDTYLAWSHYPPRNAVKYPATPHIGMIGLAKDTSRVLLGYENKIELWQLGTSEKEMDPQNRFLPIKDDRVKLAMVTTYKGEPLQCCQLSPKGTAVAYVSATKLRLFRYISHSAGNKSCLQKITCTNTDLLPLKQLLWINEIELLISTCSAQLKILTVSEDNIATLTDTLHLPDGDSATNFTVSRDECYLVTVNSSNCVVVFELFKSDVELFMLPKLSAPVTAMAINEDNELFIALSNLTFLEYDLKTRSYTQFGRQLMNSSNGEFLKSSCVISLISFDGLDKIVLHTDSQFIFINKSKESESCQSPKPRKNARTDLDLDMDSNSNSSISSMKTSYSGSFTFIDRSNHVLHFSFLNSKDLVSVEMNPIWLMDNLPPALKTKKFGAK